MGKDAQAGTKVASQVRLTDAKSNPGQTTEPPNQALLEKAAEAAARLQRLPQAELTSGQEVVCVTPKEKRILTTPSSLALAALDPASPNLHPTLTPLGFGPSPSSLIPPFSLSHGPPCPVSHVAEKKTKVVRTPEQIDRLVQKEIKEYPSIRSQNKISKTCQISAKGK